MRGWGLWSLVVLAVVLGLALEGQAEIYLWTDESGVVHMTDQWSNVPESARPYVSVRESSLPPSAAAAPQEQAASRHEPFAIEEPPRQIAPDGVQPPPPAIPEPSDPTLPYASSILVPHARSFVHQSTKPFLPFPYNVRLDRVNPDFVWVGPNRVPKDAFTFPHVSLDTQAQFNHRIRTLEQRRSQQQKPFRTQPKRSQ